MTRVIIFTLLPPSSAEEEDSDYEQQIVTIASRMLKGPLLQIIQPEAMINMMTI